MDIPGGQTHGEATTTENMAAITTIMEWGRISIPEVFARIQVRGEMHQAATGISS
jgi:hypothetical protein